MRPGLAGLGHAKLHQDDGTMGFTTKIKGVVLDWNFEEFWVLF